jgi:hydroxypyruvate isomerase
VTLRCSVCVEMIFRDLPFLERLQRVAAVGAPAFEFWRWDDKDLPAIGERARALGLACAGFSGARGGPLVDPARREDFLSGLRGAVEGARVVGANKLIATTGQALEGVERARQHASVVEGLRAAAPIVADAGVTLVLEPLNTRVDHAGYYLDTTEEGVEIVEEVGSSAVRLLFDAYHAAVMGEDVAAELRAHVGRIGHVHVADAPGRHEPGTGQVDYRAFFDALDEVGYGGYVGLEYRPAGDHAEALRSTMTLLERA